MEEALRIESHTLARTVAGRPRSVELDASLLACWANGFEESQTAGDIAHAHLQIVDDMIAGMIVEGLIDPRSDEPIRLTSAAFETEYGDEFKLSGHSL